MPGLRRLRLKVQFDHSQVSTSYKPMGRYSTYIPGDDNSNRTFMSVCTPPHHCAGKGFRGKRRMSLQRRKGPEEGSLKRLSAEPTTNDYIHKVGTALFQFTALTDLHPSLTAEIPQRPLSLSESSLNIYTTNSKHVLIQVLPCLPGLSPHRLLLARTRQQTRASQ